MTNLVPVGDEEHPLIAVSQFVEPGFQFGVRFKELAGVQRDVGVKFRMSYVDAVLKREN